MNWNPVAASHCKYVLQIAFICQFLIGENGKWAKFVLGSLDPFWDPLPFEQFSNLKNRD